jgi:hypothetical protein
MTNGTHDRAWNAKGAMPIAAWGCVIFLVMLWLFWFGARGADDDLYWQASSGWLHAFPFIGANHWSLRHTLVVPLALARLILPDGPLALALPSIIAAIAVIVIATVWVFSAAGTAAAWMTAVLLATCPILVLISSTADIDFIEIAFDLSAFFMIYRTIDGRKSLFGLFLGGILLGFGCLSRETTVFAAGAIGVLFLTGYGLPRLWYLAVAAGAAVIVGGEAMLYWIATGDPLYRLTIALHHDETINRWIEQGSAVPMIHPLVDPITMLLFNHNFGAAFLVGIPALAVCLRRHELPGPARHLVVLVFCLSAVWAGLAAALWNQLTLVPRYYTLPLTGTLMLVGVALGQAYERKRVKTALAFVSMMALANVLACVLDNHNFMFGERTLVALAKDDPGMIHTDDQTLRRAELFLHWDHLDGHVVDSPPAPGDLFFYNPPRAAQAGIKPSPDWTVEARETPPPSLAQSLLRLAPIPIPKAISARLGPGHPGTILYRVK